MLPVSNKKTWEKPGKYLCSFNVDLGRNRSLQQEGEEMSPRLEKMLWPVEVSGEVNFGR